MVGCGDSQDNQRDFGNLVIYYVYWGIVYCNEKGYGK